MTPWTKLDGVRGRIVTLDAPRIFPLCPCDECCILSLGRVIFPIRFGCLVLAPSQTFRDDPRCRSCACPPHGQPARGAARPARGAARRRPRRPEGTMCGRTRPGRSEGAPQASRCSPGLARLFVKTRAGGWPGGRRCSARRRFYWGWHVTGTRPQPPHWACECGWRRARSRGADAARAPARSPARA